MTVSKAGVKVAIEYTPIDRRRSDELFNAPRKEAKWAEVIGTLMRGQSVFIPTMDRIALESLRSIINYRKYGVLRSRSTTVDGVDGKLLRLQKHGGH